MEKQYHAGEQEVQKRARVTELAERIGRSIKDHIPKMAQDFLAHQSIVIVASSDTRGQIWASILVGTPGFIQAIDETTVTIAAEPLPNDPLYENLASNSHVGLLVIDFASRRRMRLNGCANLQPDGTLLVTAEQVYANCPKYIQSREVYTTSDTANCMPETSQTAHLTSTQQQWIAQSDTFFIATAHPMRGADASHRGGQPSFVQVLNETTLVWPDYAGNQMFNTLGNIVVHSLSGLLFIDFATGSTLQLIGHATIIWDETEVKSYIGAERLIRYHITQVHETYHALPLRWHFTSYSPFNPSIPVNNEYDR